MTTHELLELAALDALGLLDPEERAAFETGFRAASPAIQAQIRREQTRIARSEEQLLSPVEAPAGLRARVLAAVRDAMDAVSRRQIAGRIPAVLPSRGVSPIWRMVAVGSLAATVVFGVFSFKLRSDFNEMDAIMLSSRMSEQWVREFGPRFEQMMFDPATQFVKFQPASLPASGAVPGSLGQAILLIDSESNRGHFLVRNLPQTAGEYSLVVVDANGNVAEAVLVFRPADGRANEPVQNLALKPGQSLAIISTVPRAGETLTPLLRSLPI